jgi:hypothetical protein
MLEAVVAENGCSRYQKSPHRYDTQRGRDLWVSHRLASGLQCQSPDGTVQYARRLPASGILSRARAKDTFCGVPGVAARLWDGPDHAPKPLKSKAEATLPLIPPDAGAPLAESYSSHLKWNGYQFVFSMKWTLFVKANFFGLPLHTKNVLACQARSVTEVLLPTPAGRSCTELTRSRCHPYNQPLRTQVWTGTSSMAFYEGDGCMTRAIPPLPPPLDRQRAVSLPGSFAFCAAARPRRRTSSGLRR